MGRIPLVAACALVLASAAPADATEFVDDRFEDVVLAEGLDEPTAIAIGPGGRIYVAEQPGRVRVLRPDGTLDPDPVLDMADRVNSTHERGLLGMAIDRDFVASPATSPHPYLYLLYTHEDDAAKPLGPKSSRLVRIPMAPDGTVPDPDDETVLVGTGDPPCAIGEDCLPADDTTHGVGTVRQGEDGTLYAGTGDSLATGTFYDDPRAYRPYDPNSYAGKIIRVDRDGNAVADPPFCDGAGPTAPCSRAYAMGFRNPFRFNVRPGGGLVVGDVGFRDREELDLVESGRDYGWPCWEGELQTAQFSRRPQCAARYAAPPATLSFPLGSYQGANSGAGAAVYGGPQHTGASFPPEFADHLFFGDTVRGWLRHTTASGGGLGAEFATGLAYPVDMVEGPAGELLYVERLPPGRLRAIRFAETNKTPIAQVTTEGPSFGAGVSELAFEAGASFDPDGDAVTYVWDFGDGRAGTGVAPAHTYAAPGRYVVRVTVSDGSRSNSAQVVVFPGLEPPEVAIDEPAGRFSAGEEMDLRASGTAASYEWKVSLVHNDHLHPLGRFLGADAAFETMDSHDADSHYEIRLRGTSADGFPVERTVSIQPRTVAVTLASSPPGARVLWGQREHTAPATFQSAVGHRAGLTADPSVAYQGEWWPFSHWEHGGPQLGYVRVPNASTTYTAVYSDPSPAGPESPPPGAPLEGIAPSQTGVLGTLPITPPPTRAVLRGFGPRRLHGATSDPHGVRAVRVTLARGGPSRTRSAVLGPGTTERSWRLTLRSPLAPGRWTIRVRTTDATGAAATETFRRRLAPPMRRGAPRARARRR